MWIKFKLNFMWLKLMHKADKVLVQIHGLLGKIHCYKVARYIYSLIRKRFLRFDKQVMKCRILLDAIKNKN